MYFKYVFQLRAFQLLYNTVPVWAYDTIGWVTDWQTNILPVIHSA